MIDIKKILKSEGFDGQLKDNLFEILFKRYALEQIGFYSDPEYYHKITPELIQALNEFDDGMDYDDLNEEIGKYCYLALWGDPISIDVLRTKVHPRKSQGEEYGEGDIGYHTVKDLGVLFGHHHEEFLGNISTVINQGEVNDIVLYTILEQLNKEY